jgi:hypothetical protein
LEILINLNAESEEANKTYMKPITNCKPIVSNWLMCNKPWKMERVSYNQGAINEGSIQELEPIVHKIN